MEVGECGVCGSERRGDLFPSGNEREDGTTPHDNLSVRDVSEMCVRYVKSNVRWMSTKRVVGECRLEGSASEASLCFESKRGRDANVRRNQVDEIRLNEHGDRPMRCL